MTLYYVPAPAKRGALYRDWMMLALCRPWCRALVLHWHAIGLGEWLETCAIPLERWVTHRLLDRAALALVQAEAVRADAERLAPLHCVVARNGVPDPAPNFLPRPQVGVPFEVVFAGLGCREKGLFDALEGVLAANRAEPGAFRFTAMGPFASAELAADFARRSATAGGATRHLGFVSDEERNRLFATADVFCFPSYYPHEGQPAALLEALAHGLPIITTRWRGIPENLPNTHIYYVEPRRPDQVAERLAEARRAGPPGCRLREHFLAHFTLEHHHATVLAALRELAAASRP